MNNIVIGLLLPNDISVNEETVNLKTRINDNIKPSKVEAQDLYNKKINNKKAIKLYPGKIVLHNLTG